MSSLKSPVIRFIARLTWVRLEKPPHWVKKATERYEMQRIKKGLPTPYDKIKFFNGKNYTYKVFFKTIEQGKVKPIYYAIRKRRGRQKFLRKV